ncbi:MAG: lysozyme inhibitor LprI family protein [Parasphingorhabdus sp.]|uniref:lysozyme inhibitor LprI family protein n=2 Tax=Parasphingorhabdus sp. TaxID=2709688 RepID=UPI0032672C27
MILLPILLMMQPQLDCEDPVTQLDMNICSRQEFEVADKALNEQWSKVAAHKKSNDESALKNGVKGGYFEILLKSQRAWIAFKDRHCDAVADAYRGGSIRPLIYNDCRTNLTKQRTDQLQKMIEPN